ncbi:VCBS repeat-containing protein [Streptomyces sp. AC627_RSS907]|uniref:FG-GAP repeat domain-containing protein n=1 Tax=Streptomyces sp. AC627_RSS907 TaxID=2823684 RepID=UPI001C254ACD|nr:VCBS repeat-containing protein [Streptomyces sp. AC627_RSS907]
MIIWRTHVAKSSGLNTRRALARATAAALTAALVATGASSAVAADEPGPSASRPHVDLKPSGPTKYGATALPGDAPINPLFGVDSRGELYGNWPDAEGGIEPRYYAGEGWQGARAMTQADHDADGYSDGIWHVTSTGQLYHLLWDSEDHQFIGNGWKIYNQLVSPSNVGGGAADDLLARDGSGVLWLYLGYGNGKLTQRYKVGSGWNAYTHITGKGDLTGDGKDDIVAKDTSGVLWLYKGTGNYKAPFSSRARIGAGWNTYNSVVSVGDIDIDGVTDLIARDKAGALWLYKGTGNASAPFKSRVKIGNSGWNTYRLFF